VNVGWKNGSGAMSGAIGTMDRGSCGWKKTALLRIMECTMTPSATGITKWAHFQVLTSFDPEDGGSIYLGRSATLPASTHCKHTRPKLT
jgi:hypothetical protein